jgi:hypothetical protein
MTSMMAPPAAPSGFLRTKRTTLAAVDARRGPGAAVSSISAPTGLTATGCPAQLA